MRAPQGRTAEGLSRAVPPGCSWTAEAELLPRSPSPAEPSIPEPPSPVVRRPPPARQGVRSVGPEEPLQDDDLSEEAPRLLASPQAATAPFISVIFCETKTRPLENVATLKMIIFFFQYHV